MNFPELQKLADEVHLIDNKKWWTDLGTGEYPIQRNLGELKMLCKSELAEAMEGFRKNLKDDKLPAFPMPAVELVDCVIRLLDLQGSQYKQTEEIQAYYEWNTRFKPQSNFAAELDRITDIISAGHWPSAIGSCEALFNATYPELNFSQVVQAKRNFNAIRVDHTHEHRRSTHGKKF